MQFNFSQKRSGIFASEILFVLSLVAILIKIAVTTYWTPALEGDTRVLLSWTQNILDCMDRGQYVACIDGGHFPLFQYIPSLILSSLGVAQEHILRTLAYISLVSFGGLIGVFLWYSRTLKIRSRPAFLLLLLSSPLIGYARSSFGEMLAAFLIFSCTVVCLKRGSGLLLFLLSSLVCMTKDFAFLFLALVATASLMPDIVCHPVRVRRQIVGVAAGLFFGLSAVAAFNYFRMGSVYNTILLTDYFFVPTVWKQLDFFLALWFAPNSGLLFFWPLFVLLLARVGLTQIRLMWREWHKPWTLTRKGERVVRHGPFLLVMGSLFGLLLIFSRWWSPLGWVAWGPRLLLPWLPALVLVLLHFYPDSVSTWLDPWLSGWRLSIASLVVVVLCLPQFYAIFDLQRFVGMIVAPTQACPKMVSIEWDAVSYYHCMWSWLWQPEVWIVWEVLWAQPSLAKVGWGLVYVLLFFSGSRLLLAAATVPEHSLKWFNASSVTETG